jgi:hypothetical protein
MEKREPPVHLDAAAATGQPWLPEIVMPIQRVFTAAEGSTRRG